MHQIKSWGHAIAVAVLLMGHISFADGSVTTKLPMHVVANQNLMVVQGTCEARWPTMAKDIGIQKYDLGHGYTLWMVPCAQWTPANLAWTAYVQIREPAQPGGSLTKPLLFLSYDPYQGPFANNIIYNMKWDDGNKALLSPYYLNGQPQCGTMATYNWNENQQKFVVGKLVKRDDCSPNGNWEAVFPPQQKDALNAN